MNAWAATQAARRPDLLRLGYFGSYARGDWGFGSDLDLVAIVETSEAPFDRRSLDWDTLSLPVPADLLVYTREEWERLYREGGRFIQMLESEAVWVSGGDRP